jgi:hypothetical protein
MLRRLFELDCADSSGLITIGETTQGDVVSMRVEDEQKNVSLVYLDRDAFLALADLRYKVDFPLKTMLEPLRITQAA